MFRCMHGRLNQLYLILVFAGIACISARKPLYLFFAPWEGSLGADEFVEFQSLVTAVLRLEF